MKLFKAKDKETVTLTPEQLARKFDHACGNVLHNVRKESALLVSREGQQQLVDECKTFSGMILTELLNSLYGEKNASEMMARVQTVKEI